MNQLPESILRQVLQLRSQNGLEPTEAATLADLAKSKAKWSVSETPRYRRAGRSPLFVSGRYLTSAGYCPATGETDTHVSAKVPQRNESVTSAGNQRKVDEIAFYRTLHGKGFDVRLSQNLLTNDVEVRTPAPISKLGLQFGPIPAKAANVHVTQTSPQVQVSMSLESFLEIAGIKP